MCIAVAAKYLIQIVLTKYIVTVMITNELARCLIHYLVFGLGRFSR